MTKKKTSKRKLTAKDLGVEETVREEEKFTDLGKKSSKKSAHHVKKHSRNAFSLLLLACAGFIVGYFIFNSGDSALEQKTGVQIERQIRDVILIPEDEEVVTLSYINTEEALKTLKSGNNNLLEQAEVGDYYVVFEDRAILYRDSENKIINYAPIIRTE